MPDPSNPYSGYNAMQAHLGVSPMSQIPSPGDAAQMMVSQSAQQRVAAMSAGALPSSWGGGGGGASVFGEQFRQRFNTIQSQQSYNPYMAQAMSGGSGYAPGMLPSPVMMTPPSTGVFRTRTQGPAYAPLPPQPMMPPIRTPFTPMPTSPMFQMESDRRAMQEDMERNASFSRAIQAPRIIGQGMAIGGTAALGGMIGGPLGAIGGGILGHTSGFAQGMGNLAMRPFQPMIERRQMGASLQRMSQNWVVNGPDMHSTGRGFSRDASIRLAEEIQDLAQNKAFQKETGGMFNRGDLMRITQESGKAGLLDESQDIEGVRKNIKNVSRTLRKYMQLTQDPDMVNVLRELGQMKQFGMTLDDMEQAAQSMNRYSRAAGASIAGIKQMGMAGASTFQQAGLSAGSGMTYGMHAAAAARQAVATGTFQPRELALLGGVQGVAQRDMQAQAAMLSMPLFGAAAGRYGAGGFQLNQAGLGSLGTGGGAGMVRQAVSNMGAATQQGGVGALALFPLQQRRLQTEAAENMTPGQLTAMRFQMSMRTGQQLGLQGAGAFGAGSRMLFGDEVAEQMMYQAQNPRFFQAQRERIAEQRDRLAREQRAEAAEAAPGFGRRMVLRDRGLRGAVEGFAEGRHMLGSVASTSFGRVGEMFGGIRDRYADIEARAEGRSVMRIDPRAITRGPQEAAAVRADAALMGEAGLRDVEVGGPSSATISRAMGQATGMPTRGMAEAAGGLLKVAAPVQGLLGNALGISNAPAAGLEAMMGAQVSAALGEDTTNRLVTRQMEQATRFKQTARTAATTAGTAKGRNAALSAIKKATKGKVSGGAFVTQLAGKIADQARKGIGFVGATDSTTTQDQLEKTLLTTFREQGMSEREAKKALEDMRASGQLQDVLGLALRQGKKMAGPEYADEFGKAEDEASMLTDDEIADRQAEVQKKKELQLGAIESALDMTYDVQGASLGDKTGAEELREFVEKSDTGAVLAAAAAASEGKGGAYEEAYKQYKKLYGKGKSDEEMRAAFDKKVMEQQEKGVSGDLKTALRRASKGEEAGGTGKAMQALADLSVGAKEFKQYGGVIGGGLQTVMEAVGGESEVNLTQLMRGDVTGKGIVESIDKAGNRQQARGGHRALAAKIARAQSAKTPEERQKAEEEVMAQVSSMGEAREKEEKDRREATGKEAEDLAKSDEALAAVQGEMAAAFKDFRPAVEKFADGAERLQKALDSDMFKRIAEGG